MTLGEHIPQSRWTRLMLLMSAFVLLCAILVVFDTNIAHFWPGNDHHHTEEAEYGQYTGEPKPPLFEIHTPTAGEMEYHSEDGRYGWVVQELVCPVEGPYCWEVVDVLYEREEGTLRYAREIRVHNNSGITMTGVQLENPLGEPFTRENAKKWTIGREHSDYVKVMLAQPFVTGTFQLPSPLRAGRDRVDNITYRTLMIGLGGAAFPLLLESFDTEGYHHEVISVEIDPSVKYIAVEWFHYTHEDRIIVEDGVKYMARLADKGEKRFDFIAIDVCSTDYDAEKRGEIICPCPVFLQAEVINYAKQLLAEKGTLAVNTLALKGNAEENGKILEQRAKVYADFQPHFNDCYFAIQYNAILICTSFDSGLMTEERHNRTIQSMPPEFRSIFDAGARIDRGPTMRHL